MMRASRLASIVLITAACVVSCAKKQPTSRPVTVEDVLPFGAPVCFPKGMTNESSEPGASVNADTTPIAPVTQPATLPAGPSASLNHWCALCAAAAQRAAEFGRNRHELPTPESDLLIDLPPR